MKRNRGSPDGKPLFLKIGLIYLSLHSLNQNFDTIDDVNALGAQAVQVATTHVTAIQ